MKRSMLIAICLVFCASFAFAQAPGSIMVFSDAAYTDCNIPDTAVGLLSTYVVHKYAAGATASQFKLEVQPCNAMTFTGATNAFPTTIGDIFTGISVAYGACLNGDILLVTVNWFSQTLTPPCCLMEVVPDPVAPEGIVIVVDCASNKLAAYGGISVINPDETCDCEALPVNESTWGGIKALYQ